MGPPVTTTPPSLQWHARTAAPEAPVPTIPRVVVPDDPREAVNDGPGQTDGRWPPGLVVVAHVLSLIPLAAVVALATATTLSLAVGWSPNIVTSGSMAPWMQPGDILLASPASPASLGEGDVVVFDSAEAPGGQITHRLVQLNADGTWITKGDANARADAGSVAPERISGEVRMIIPRIGLPSLWIRKLELLPLALWTGVLALSVLGVVRTYNPASRILRSGPRGGRSPGPRPAARAYTFNLPFAQHPLMLLGAGLGVGAFVSLTAVGTSLALSSGSLTWVAAAMGGLLLLIPTAVVLGISLKAVRRGTR